MTIMHIHAYFQGETCHMCAIFKIAWNFVLKGLSACTMGKTKWCCLCASVLYIYFCKCWKSISGVFEKGYIPQGPC